jgi:hypothetical protein
MVRFAIKLLLNGQFYSLSQTVVVVFAIQSDSLRWNAPEEIPLSGTPVKVRTGVGLLWLDRAA